MSPKENIPKSKKTEDFEKRFNVLSGQINQKEKGMDQKTKQMVSLARAMGKTDTDLLAMGFSEEELGITPKKTPEKDKEGPKTEDQKPEVGDAPTEIEPEIKVEPVNKRELYFAAKAKLKADLIGMGLSEAEIELLMQKHI